MFLFSFTDVNAIKTQPNDLPDESFANANDSWDLDLSLPTTSKRKTKKGSDDDNETKFVPAKGQKTATKRLQKISGKLLQSGKIIGNGCYNEHFELQTN